jgi:hypothetical protein
MKTPTVDDPKPKRDKLGPTGPAEVSGEDASKSNGTAVPGGDGSYEKELENILERKDTTKPSR